MFLEEHSLCMWPAPHSRSSVSGGTAIAASTKHRLKIFGVKILESSKKQSLNLPNSGNESPLSILGFPTTDSTEDGNLHLRLIESTDDTWSPQVQRADCALLKSIRVHMDPHSSRACCSMLNYIYTAFRLFLQVFTWFYVLLVFRDDLRYMGECV